MHCRLTVLCIALVCLFPCGSLARDIFVSPAGNYSSLQTAINNALSGDFVFVTAEISTAELKFSQPQKNISIIGLNGKPTINSVIFSGLQENIKFHNIVFEASFYSSRFLVSASSSSSYVRGLEFNSCDFYSKTRLTAAIDAQAVSSSLIVTNSKCRMPYPFISSLSSNQLSYFQIASCILETDCSVGMYLSSSLPAGEIRFDDNVMLQGSSKSYTYQLIRLSFTAPVVNFRGNLVKCDSISSNVQISFGASISANISSNFIEADDIFLSSSSGAYEMRNNVFRDNYSSFSIRLPTSTNLILDARLNWWPKGTIPSSIVSLGLPTVLKFFPWYINGTDQWNRTALACPASCPLATCNFFDGSCPTDAGQTSAGIFVFSVGVPLLFFMYLFACCCCRLRIRTYHTRTYYRLAGLPFRPERDERARLLFDEQAPESQVWIEEGVHPKRVVKKNHLNGMCLVCSAAPPEYAGVPCGHLCMCGGCAEACENKGSCPFCQAKMRHVQRVFL